MHERDDVTPPDDDKGEVRNSSTNQQALWIGVGIAMGGGIGAAMDNLAVGIAIGVVIGVAIGVSQGAWMKPGEE